MAARHGAGDGRSGGAAVLDARVFARLFRDPKLPLLLAYPRMLAATLRDEGHDVGVAPSPYGADLGIPRDLWPADGSPPAWLRAFLDPETPAVLREIVAHLLAARPEPTPCWNAGEPTLREQRARAAALLRVAARGSDAESAAGSTETWWSTTWRPPVAAHERDDAYPWFLRTLRSELHEGPTKSPAARPRDEVDETAGTDSAAQPRRRLTKMPAADRAAHRPRNR